MNTTVQPSWLPLGFALVTAVVWFAVNRALFRDILSPFGLLFFAWVLPLFLQAMNLSYLETPWTLRATLLVGWVTLVLIVVSLGAAWFVSPRGPQAPRAFADELNAFRSPTFLLLFALCYTATFLIYLYVEFLTNPGGVPLLSVELGRDASSAVHRWGKDSPLQAIIALLFVLTPLGYLAYRANRGPLLRAALLFSAALYPLMGVLKLSRSDVFIGMISVGVAAWYARRWLPGPRSRRAAALGLAVAGGALVGLMYVMMSLRISSIAVQDLYAGFIGFRIEPGVPLRGVAAAIYGYLALPFENLNRFIAFHDSSVWHPGASVLRPLLSVSGFGNFADEINSAVAYPPVVSPAAGSATFLTAVYAELGWLGAALVPALYALLVNTLYVRMRRAPGIVSLLLYAAFVYPWLWLYFNNGFSVLSIYINAGFIVAMGLLVSEFGMTSRPVRAAQPA